MSVIMAHILNIFTSSEPSGLLGEHSAYLCSGVPQPFPKMIKYMENRREGGIITLRSLATDSAISCGIEQLTSHYTVPGPEHGG